jgi:hypothetical protein
VKAISITVRGQMNGHVLVKTAWDGEALCRIPVGKENVWHTIREELALPDGVNALYFTYEGGGYMSLKSFELHV